MGREEGEEEERKEGNKGGGGREGGRKGKRWRQSCLEAAEKDEYYLLPKKLVTALVTCPLKLSMMISTGVSSQSLCKYSLYVRDDDHLLDHAWYCRFANASENE